jgi:hypothetical protein
MFSVRNYTDIIIDGDQFSIQRLSSEEKENKYHAGLALITLDRIEEVLRRGLTYLAMAEDSYSKMSPDELKQELKQLAEFIKTNYLKKSQNLSYARRFFGGVAQEEEGIRSAYQRIMNLIAPPPVFDLPNELTAQICSLLEQCDLGRLAQVNKHADAHVKEEVVQRAREYGYQGNDFAEAKNYFQFIRSLDFDTLVKDGVISEAYIVRRKRSFVDFEATLRNIKQLSEVEQPLKEKLNKALIRYSYEGNAVACHTLLHLGADIEASLEMFGFPVARTALSWAAFKGNKDVVKVLIQNGANVNATSINLLTPLYLASDPEIVSLLVENGAVQLEPVPHEE